MRCTSQCWMMGMRGARRSIVVHGNSLEHVTDTYKRFLEGRFRKAFNLSGTPLRIEMKTSTNPYADKESS